MGAAVVIGLLWIAFAGVHLVLSSARLRPRLRAQLGEPAFRGLYSAAALGTFVPLVWTFATHKHAGPVLWATLGPPTLARWAAYALMALACVLVIASLLPGSAAPSSMAAPHAATEPRGVLRITRHPMLAGIGCFGAAHLLVNGSLGDVLFFGGFPLFCWVGARHQDARLAREKAGYAALVDRTGIVPFAAVLRGRQRVVARELPAVAVAVGLLVFVVLRSWHGTLFGP